MELSTVTMWSTFTNTLDVFCFAFLLGLVCGLILSQMARC
jgi:hypothetical protein